MKMDYTLTANASHSRSPVILMAWLVFSAAVCFAENPLVQTNYTPDPAPMVYNDTVFLYTGHDEDNATGFTMYNYLLYTSTDLVNWRDHGVIASTKSFSWANSNGAWASQCIPRNGKFYYYCAMQLKGIGVLVADSPYGPFTDPIGRPLITNGEIDPTVFIDDDDQAYLFFGNPTCRYVKLNKDMTSYSGGVVTLPSLQTYQEGPWIYKRDSKYYLSWSSTCCPEGIGYAMSDKATGPWTYKNSIMDGNSNSSGNQPGMFDFKGSTYTTGFTNELWYSIQGGRTVRYERRSASLAKLTFAADGTIPKIPWFGIGNPTPGVPQVGTFNPFDTVQAETINWCKGVRTKVCSDSGGGMHVDSVHNNDLVKVKGVDFGTGGATSFMARVASATSGGAIELRLDSLAGRLVGTCAVAGTGGWQTWATRTCSVSGATGMHDLYFKFTGGNGLLFNFNWWKFTSPETGIDRSGSNNRGSDGALRATIDGRERQLRLDFGQPLPQERVKVDLFDLSGRLAATLFTGHQTSGHLTVPLAGAAGRHGTFLVVVSAKNSIVLTKSICLH